MTSLPPLRLDHIVYAAPDLDWAVEQLEERLGVRASAGGRHPGLGTRNALVALSDRAYLEVIAPDPAQPKPAHPRPFGIDQLSQPRIATWAAKESRLEERIAAARAAGFDPGTPVPVSRNTPDGQTLSWRLSIRAQPGGDGLVPFLIDWGHSDGGAPPHPADSATPGCRLISLRAEHPSAAAVLQELAAIGARLDVAPGPAPALIALLETPNGQVELR